MNVIDIATVLGAYLIGSVSFAVVVSKAMNLPDPHSYGSGNPGATNVLRTGNKKAAMFTLIGDFLKGTLAVVLAKWAASSYGANGLVVPLAVLAVFMGHCWPIFHKFQGGKGVATAGGIFLGLSAALAGLVTLVWLVTAVLFRMSSLAALVAAAASPFLAAWWFGVTPVVYALALIALVLIVRHRENVKKILNGTESKIGQKKN
jgi:acyl phosphate:glycerol-3-phosphate acyltransferase